MSSSLICVACFRLLVRAWCLNQVLQVFRARAATSAEYFYTMATVQPQHKVTPLIDTFGMQLIGAIQITVIQ